VDRLALVYLRIARKLAKDNPTSAEALRNLSISLEKLGARSWRVLRLRLLVAVAL